MYNYILLKAYAKINLFLEIIKKRDDGFHDIFTIMQSVSLADRIGLTKNDDQYISIKSNNILIPLDESNIAFKAAKAFYSYTGIKGGIEIYLEKNIPTEAGMAGGSADGAAVIVGLSELYGISLSQNELIEIASTIGSDVPFCLFGGTYSAQGRGEVLQKMKDIEPFSMVIIKPLFSISTGWAYQQYAHYSTPPESADRIIDRIGNPLTRNASLYNVFEELCSGSYQEINSIKAECLTLGADAVMMTGSGSAFFALSKEKNILHKIAEYFDKKGYFATLCQTVPHGIEVLERK
ncbi:MAG: 4-(cytidine 5'-diphospho)-2-C-methyl-D-erythritol kinase [Candidatus Margulisiibacteriota bacterium]|nr:MAG: 4-(cytidine 5'-diphospho)-2-C-methyl-D-erythritol kinase [Candidatus Margulisbacteria bacterium GWD2_39_127]OGI02143.1 MAG: 4-(cytidine 5'-diphospho)-2-C-methyl-D-erythritol kinase [Candidatus Margulisbacteria bacterium GWF2_38_17]OGI10519.1 MAG: 4-(cytidine 5'-diphospho)-2-C-methyl-D-erythritol kinase [Candidatus Margulisbacteria bacterium GWE2_39_32]PZM79933.1 MAG: 4-(cytidine 5'-diphospho)-2-C-methyl-D-erythritol kinase [Candidatus Margulisiibacteriota bacterium]HAR62360.1 4-(cytidin